MWSRYERGKRMTRERIEDMREVVLPFVKKRLLETNYEGLGKSDEKEFEREFNEILNLAIKSLEQESRWIPVSERLPDTDDEVLCWYEYYHWSQEKVLPDYGIGCYFKETSAWYGEVAVGRDVRVIAWMPLHPYKAESEDNNE